MCRQRTARRGSGAVVAAGSTNFDAGVDELLVAAAVVVDVASRIFVAGVVIAADSSVLPCHSRRGIP